MLGGINNGLFFQGFGGFIVLGLILIPLMRWIFQSPSEKRARLERKRIKKDLRRLRRK
jgi:hypothetical protein